jgi:hypothetical protein
MFRHIAWSSLLGLGVLGVISSAWAERTDASVQLIRGEPYLVDAGRSPLPQPGESIQRPIAFKRLAPETPRSAPPVPASGIVPWSQAARYADAGPITVEGVIVDTYQIRDVACRLNFDKNWRDKFYLAVFKSAYEGLRVPPAEYYKGKKVRATGLVTLHKNQPTLEVRDLSQLVVVD